MTTRVPYQHDVQLVGDAVVEIKNAVRRFGSQVVFSGVGFTLRPGERLHLRGANGSGKTTLLRCLLGTVHLTSGSMQIDGRRPGSRRARIGACLNPEQSLYSKITGHENLLFAARLRLPARAVARAVAAIETELELEQIARVRVDRCSAGMRARLNVARALLAGPRLVLLDEPTRSLDDESHFLVWRALDRRPDLTIIIVSHRPEDGAHCNQSYDLPSRP